MAAEAVSPYVGLMPYTEDDARFFFGRERETRLVISNLFASRLTLLYGASGVGKSSVLRAGVLHQLQDRAARAAARGEAPEQVAVYLKNWQGDVLVRFRGALEQALVRSFPDIGEAIAEGGSDLADLLTAVSDRFEVDLLLVFDQFEEYFLYHDGDAGEDPFTRQLAAAVLREGLPASFLLVLRDDALARLDRFKTRIPRLFSNYLRLRPLDRAAARQAIVEPVAVYNQLPSAIRTNGHVRVEPELVDAVLEQVRRGRVQVGEGGRGGETAEAGIEAAFLQLVMTRVWEAEVGSGSRALRSQTLADLGGAATIVRGHLDRVMAELSAEEHRICASIFEHLVTPSGTKIAHTAMDLASLADVELGQIELLLSGISGSGMRLLTPVAPADAVGEVRYEIYHDALAQAMLDWRRRYAEEREREELEAEAKRQRWELEKERRTARRLRGLAIGLAVAMALALGALVFAWIQTGRAEDSARKAEEQEQAAMTARERATEVAEELKTALDAKAEEERQRLEAEARAAELAGESEKAEQLREEVESSRQQSQRRARLLADLGTTLGADDRVGETGLVDLAYQQLEGLRDRHLRELARAERAEQQLEQTFSELKDARETIASLRRLVEVSIPQSFEIERLRMGFVSIPAGRFKMGSPKSEILRFTDELLHDVVISHAFWMGETEVTQGQWRNLMRNNPSRFSECGDDCPVENVNWFEAVTFANRLSEQESLGSCYELRECESKLNRNLECKSVTFKGLRCQGYRLPTEAEWEYAVRAGTATPFWTGTVLTTEQANYDGNWPYPDHQSKGRYRETTVAVRSFQPNSWGLYEVHGNVGEWVDDWFAPYSEDDVIDPVVPEPSQGRVLRGGSWTESARACRSAIRHGRSPSARSASTGFRLARSFPYSL